MTSILVSGAWTRCCCAKTCDDEYDHYSYYYHNPSAGGSRTGAGLELLPTAYCQPGSGGQFIDLSANAPDSPDLRISLPEYGPAQVTNAAQSNSPSRSRRLFRQIYFGVKIAIFATVSLYLLVPFVYHITPSIQRHIVFLPYVRWPTGVNFSDPESEGISGGQNTYLEPEPGSRVGVWHFLPISEVENSRDQPSSYWIDSLRNSGKHIFLYMHGNSGSRAGEHRKELYKLLQNLDFHVICFDYRGYADSAPIPPNETSVVKDGKFVYKWVRKIIGNKSDGPKLIVWGHSLGTGVSSHVVANLCLEGDPPAALIMESPFTSIAEEVKYHMLSALWRYMPGFEWIFTSPLKRNDIAFESDRHIANIHIPIFILHAVDDPVVPYFLGKKLYKAGLNTRTNDSKPIYFQRFGEGYAHKFICRSPDLPELILEFIRCTASNKWPCQSLDKKTLESFIEIEPID